MTRLVDRAAAVLDRHTSRRGFLARAAVVGSALAVAPGRFLLRPGTAYASVCGDDSTCASGYTVFCATVNNGVNRCPPGALVGGWWKADNSGFCCGSARYYIDCHSSCFCGCSPGVQFCGEGCRYCTGGCGPASSCDQRRVCVNNFRYGQCNQDVGCTGPVWCRVVTCTPPWRIPAWDCTATSATDNRTGTHSAPGLPYCTAIDAKYTSLGGPGSFLGEAQTGEVALARAGGAFTAYDGGSVYWSPGSGAHEVHGLIRDAWARLGWENGHLGYPVTDETPTPDTLGRYNHFTGDGAGPEAGASVYWTPPTGAHAVMGNIRAAWAAMGWETVLGYPLTDETTTPDGLGRYNHFNGGGTGTASVASIYWTPVTGAHAVYGAIRAKWSQLGWEAGPVGYPVTDELGTPDGIGRYNHFNGGSGAGGVTSIYWTPATGAHAVIGLIRAAWQALGWETGPLGYPVTDEMPTADGRGRYNDFVGGGTAAAPLGSIYWTPQTGAHSVLGPIRAAWLGTRGSAGPLGFPTTEPVPIGGLVRSTFEHGSITYNPATGVTTIHHG